MRRPFRSADPIRRSARRKALEGDRHLGRSPAATDVAVEDAAAEESLRQLTIEAEPLHAGPVLVDEVTEQNEILQLAGAIAEMVPQDRLGDEAELLEHADRRLLLGDDLDEELAKLELADGTDERLPREIATDAGPAALRHDEEAHLTDVTRQGDAGQHRDVARDLAVVERDPPERPEIIHDRTQRLRVRDVLLEERAIVFGDRAKEGVEAVVVGLL